MIDEVTFVWVEVGTEPTLHKEPLEFEALPLAQRNYKT
mgnify:CR=1 FL=1